MVDRRPRSISRRRLILAAGLSSLGGSHWCRRLLAREETPPQVPLRRQNPNRQEFVSRLRRVQDGDHRDNVVKLLGRPDEIRGVETVVTDSSGYGRWCYGTSGPGTLATLATVSFQNGHVTGLIGKKGEPPDPAVIDERELRTGLQFLHQGWEWPVHYDPLHLIRITNYLAPIGKEKALAIICEYNRVGPYFDQFWLSLLLLAAFEVPRPPGYMPRLSIGAIEPSPPTEPLRVPRFPIIMTDDIPFSVLQAYVRSGPGRRIHNLDYFQKHGTLRNQKLRPPDDPYLSLRNLAESEEVNALDHGVETRKWTASGNKHLLLQVLALCRTVNKWPEAQERRSDYATIFDRYHSDFLLAKPKWDENLQLYIRGDGSHEKLKSYL